MSEYLEKLRLELTLLRSGYNAVAQKRRMEDWEFLAKLSEEIETCERRIALAQGDEAALVIPLPFRWRPLPAPVLEVSTGQADLRCPVLAKRISPPSAQQSIDFVDLRFRDCVAIYFTNINDELFQSQPLFGKGLSIGRAHSVRNSRWLDELRKAHSNHLQFREADWIKKEHFILTFKDCTFECIAQGFEVIWI